MQDFTPKQNMLHQLTEELSRRLGQLRQGVHATQPVNYAAPKGAGLQKPS